MDSFFLGNPMNATKVPARVQRKHCTGNGVTYAYFNEVNTFLKTKQDISIFPIELECIKGRVLRYSKINGDRKQIM